MHGHTAAIVGISGNIRHMQRSEHFVPLAGSAGWLADATQDDVMLPVRKGTCRDLWSINKSFPRILQHKFSKSLIQVCHLPEADAPVVQLGVC
jgi:hypothetical protein